MASRAAESIHHHMPRRGRFPSRDQAHSLSVGLMPSHGSCTVRLVEREAFICELASGPHLSVLQCPTLTITSGLLGNLNLVSNIDSKRLLEPRPQLRHCPEEDEEDRWTLQRFRSSTSHSYGPISPGCDTSAGIRVLFAPAWPPL